MSEAQAKDELRKVANRLAALDTSECPYWLQEDIAHIQLDLSKAIESEGGEDESQASD